MTARELAFVALGSNLGDRSAHLAQARSALSLLPSSSLAALSAIEETAPMGALAQGPYLNQMAALRTSLDPEALLSALQRIELGLGRRRSGRWAARTIDLDIVDFGGRAHRSRRLTLPHPGRDERAFWVRELTELRQLLLSAK